MEKVNAVPGMQIASTGIYLPKKVLANDELEKMVDTSDEWITTRTGIKERRISAPGELTADLGAEAAKMAMKNAELSPKDIDLILVATISPDAIFPSVACSIQQRIAATHACAMDLQAACTGFIYGLVMVSGFIATGKYKNILLIGAERISAYIDWSDRNTCVLFGDGAGAVIIRPTEDKRSNLIAHHLGADGRAGDVLYLNNGRKDVYFGCDVETLPREGMVMSGQEVFKKAVIAMYHSATRTMKEAGCTVDDIKCVISHQANIRIINALSDRLKVPKEKRFINVQRYGNISAACIPVALHEAKDYYPLERGDKILLVAFGGGLTWGSAIIEW
ncbi:MAG: beta-ketoacyl-ACP synthase III [Verrucomicrobiota bacterium]